MRFAVTFDYLCPFAYIGNELVLRAEQGGAGHEVSYLPFSLAQAHTEEGATPAWDSDPLGPGVLALEWGLAIRDHLPERFPAAHLALFGARHDRGLDLREPDVVRDAVAAAGTDPDEVAKLVADGGPRAALAEEHARAVDQHAVFGVPTFIVGDRAVFVRLMEHVTDPAVARATLDRLLELQTGWPELNEFKTTRVPR